MIKKVSFSVQVFKMVILMDLHDMRSPESEKHILTVWSVISITQKQITSETSNWYSTIVSYIDAT